MAVDFPQFGLPTGLSGGSDTWDNGLAGELLSADYFGTVEPISGSLSVALDGLTVSASATVSLAATLGASLDDLTLASAAALEQVAIEVPWDGGSGHVEARDRLRRAQRDELRSAVETAFRRVFGNDEEAETEYVETAASPENAPVSRAAVVDYVEAELALNGLRSTLGDIEATLIAYERQRTEAAALLAEEEAIVMLLVA